MKVGLALGTLWQSSQGQSISTVSSARPEGAESYLVFPVPGIYLPLSHKGPGDS